MRILIVEDQKDLADGISSYLLNEHFSCDVAYTYEQAQSKIYLNEYSCIVLDITLPDGNGLNLLKELQQKEMAGSVLIISAKNSLDDKLFGLHAGADDYLTKPFHLAELSARVTAIIRRRSFDGKNSLLLGDLTLNLIDKSVTVNQQTIQPTKTEYAVLLYFIANKNKVVTKEAIVEHLWGEEIDIADNYDFIYTHISNLKKKLAQAGSQVNIKAIYGMGYKFSVAL